MWEKTLFLYIQLLLYDTIYGKSFVVSTYKCITKFRDYLFCLFVLCFETNKVLQGPTVGHIGTPDICYLLLFFHLFLYPFCGWTPGTYQSYSTTPLLSWTRERKQNKRLMGWNKNKERFLCSYYLGQETQLEDISLMYCKSKQCRTMRNKAKS